MYFWLETGMEINLNIETFNLGDISKNYPVNMIYQIIQPHKWLHSCRAQTPQSMYFGVTDNYDNQYCIIYSIFKHYPVYPVLSGIILHFSTPHFHLKYPHCPANSHTQMQHQWNFLDFDQYISFHIFVFFCYCWLHSCYFDFEEEALVQIGQVSNPVTS